MWKVLSHLVPLTTLHSMYCYDSHFTIEKTEAHRDYVTCPNHTAGQWWCQDLDPHSLTPEPEILTTLLHCSKREMLGMAM